MHRLFALVLSLLLLPLTPAVEAAELSVEQLRDCQQIDDGSARLACFDAFAERVLAEGLLAPETISEASAPSAASAAAVVEASEPAEAAIVAAEPQVEPATEPGGEAEFGRREEPEKPESIQTVIDKTDKTAYGKLILYLENGQIWQQLDSLRTTFKAGDEIIISSAVSGSFLLRKSTGGTRIRVRRLDV